MRNRHDVKGEHCDVGKMVGRSCLYYDWEDQKSFLKAFLPLSI